MLVKQLGYLGDSQAAGIVLGGRVPIVLTGRADSALERVASCALALLLTRRRRATHDRLRDSRVPDQRQAVIASRLSGRIYERAT